MGTSSPPPSPMAGFEGAPAMPGSRALGAVGAVAESSQARVRAFDWLRGLAVLVMIETHSLVLLRPELYATRAGEVLNFFNGLVAPSFIFAAGFSLALVQVRTAAAGGPRTGRVLRTLRRIGEVLAVGTLVNWVWFPISIDPGWLLRVDILQCIGLTLLAALPLYAALARRPRALAGVSLGIALALFLVAPFAEAVRGPLQDLFNKNGPRHTVFPLLPWAGWAFLGGTTGALAASGTGLQVRRLAMAIGAGSLVVWLMKPVWLALYPPHEFWVTDPANSAIRGACVMALLLLLLAIESRVVRGARRAPGVWLLELFGTSSLAAYFFHEMLLHYEVRGVSLGNALGGKCDWLGFAALTLVVIGLTAGLSWLTDRVYRRLDRRKPRPLMTAPLSA